jgi:hypothetical protein
VHCDGGISRSATAVVACLMSNARCGTALTPACDRKYPTCGCGARFRSEDTQRTVTGNLLERVRLSLLPAVGSPTFLDCGRAQRMTGLRLCQWIRRLSQFHVHQRSVLQQARG